MMAYGVSRYCAETHYPTGNECWSRGWSFQEVGPWGGPKDNFATVDEGRRLPANVNLKEAKDARSAKRY
jgi:hypothetical protein